MADLVSRLSHRPWYGWAEAIYLLMGVTVGALGVSGYSQTMTAVMGGRLWVAVYSGMLCAVSVVGVYAWVHHLRVTLAGAMLAVTLATFAPIVLMSWGSAATGPSTWVRIFMPLMLCVVYCGRVLDSGISRRDLRTLSREVGHE